MPTTMPWSRSKPKSVNHGKPMPSDRQPAQADLMRLVQQLPRDALGKTNRKLFADRYSFLASKGGK